jgi:hypothetical protein
VLIGLSFHFLGSSISAPGLAFLSAGKAMGVAFLICRGSATIAFRDTGLAFQRRAVRVDRVFEPWSKICTDHACVDHLRNDTDFSNSESFLPPGLLNHPV